MKFHAMKKVSSLKETQHKYLKENKNFIEIKTDNFFIKLNKNKGLSIFSQSLIENGKELCILGTVEHGLTILSLELIFFWSICDARYEKCISRN